MMIFNRRSMLHAASLPCHFVLLFISFYILRNLFSFPSIAPWSLSLSPCRFICFKHISFPTSVSMRLFFVIDIFGNRKKPASNTNKKYKGKMVFLSTVKLVSNHPHRCNCLKCSFHYNMGGIWNGIKHYCDKIKESPLESIFSPVCGDIFIVLNEFVAPTYKKVYNGQYIYGVRWIETLSKHEWTNQAEILNGLILYHIVEWWHFFARIRIIPDKWAKRWNETFRTCRIWVREIWNAWWKTKVKEWHLIHMKI